MPYVDQQTRAEFEPELEALFRCMMSSSRMNTGTLNYLMTRIADAYVDKRGLSYQTLSDIDAAFGAGGKEFYRRVTVPYEDRKLAENGDVYSPRDHSL